MTTSTADRQGRRRQRPSTWRKVLIAVLVVAAIAVTAMLATKPAGHDRIEVTAQFQDAVGLYVGNSVSVLGMPIGTVTSVTPENGLVKVAFEVEKDVAIPADVQAVTVSTSILTDRHIELTPPYRSGPKLSNGDIIGLGRTRTPVEFDRTLAMADKLSRSLSGNGRGDGPVADLIGIGSKIASGSGEQMKTALDQLSQALRLSSDNGTATRENIQSITTSLAALTKVASDNDTTIRDFGSNIRALSDLLAQERLGTGRAGADLNQVLAQAADLLEKNRDGVKTTAVDFQQLMQTVADNRRELAETLDLLPLAGTNVYNAIDTATGTARVHALIDKLFLNGQMAKETCNLAGIKDLGCNTGTINDYAPNFGAKFYVDSMTGLLENMAGMGAPK